MLGTTGSILFELQFNYEFGTAFSYNGSEIEAPLKVDAGILVYSILSIFVSYFEDCVIFLLL
jgi:hypothetical protein